MLDSNAHAIFASVCSFVGRRRNAPTFEQIRESVQR
jgi:hypothetical protein